MALKGFDTSIHPYVNEVYNGTVAPAPAGVNLVSGEAIPANPMSGAGMNLGNDPILNNMQTSSIVSISPNNYRKKDALPDPGYSAFHPIWPTPIGAGKRGGYMYYPNGTCQLMDNGTLVGVWGTSCQDSDGIFCDNLHWETEKSIQPQINLNPAK